MGVRFQRGEKSFRHAETAFFRAQKALKNGDHHRAGHPSGFPHTPSAPLTKGSALFDRLQEGRALWVRPSCPYIRLPLLAACSDQLSVRLRHSTS